MTKRFKDWSGSMYPPAEQTGLGYHILDHRIWDTQSGCLTDDR